MIENKNLNSTSQTSQKHIDNQVVLNEDSSDDWTTREMKNAVIFLHY